MTKYDFTPYSLDEIIARSAYVTTNAIAELAQLRDRCAQQAQRIAELTDDKYCPLCTWRGNVELVNGICPQCGVDWPKAYREYRDALTIAKERIAEQARQLAEAHKLLLWLEWTDWNKWSDRVDAWLAANPAPEDSHQ